MAWVAQLLPDLEQARAIRDALAYYLQKLDISEEERDICWTVLADLTKKMHDYGHKNPRF